MIGGIPKQKTARITDAMTDLQLGIDGLRSRLPEIRDGNQWVHATGAFARISSMFLRKTVLGDRDRRETQLLDDRVLGSISLQFGRLRKIPRDKRREIEVGFSLALVIHNHPHRTGANLRGKLVPCRAHNGSTFSRVGAPAKPGADRTLKCIFI